MVEIEDFFQMILKSLLFRGFDGIFLYERSSFRTQKHH